MTLNDLKDLFAQVKEDHELSRCSIYVKGVCIGLHEDLCLMTPEGKFKLNGEVQDAVQTEEKED